MTTTTVPTVARLRVCAAEGDGVATRGLEWPAFWQQLRKRLAQDGFRPNTLRVYRQVLRDLRTFLSECHGVTRPAGLSAQSARGFLVFLSEKNVSWSWMATSIAVMCCSFASFANVTMNSWLARRVG